MKLYLNYLCLRLKCLVLRANLKLSTKCFKTNCFTRFCISLKLGENNVNWLPKINLCFAKLEWINKIFPRKDSVHWHLRTTPRKAKAGEVCTQLFQCTFYFPYYMPFYSAFNLCQFFFRAKKVSAPPGPKVPVRLWRLRSCVCNTGLADMACKTDFAHFLCDARLSCTYTKTTIRLTGSFIFFEFTRTSASNDHCQGLNLPQLWKLIKKELTTSVPNKHHSQLLSCLFNLSHQLSWTLSSNLASSKTLKTPL